MSGTYHHVCRHCGGESAVLVELNEGIYMPDECDECQRPLDQQDRDHISAHAYTCVAGQLADRAHDRNR